MTQHAGHENEPPKLQSPDDVRRYVRNLSARDAAEDRTVKLYRMVERMTLVLVLAACGFNFYMLTVIQEIIAMPHLEIPTARLTVRTQSMLDRLVDATWRPRA